MKRQQTLAKAALFFRKNQRNLCHQLDKSLDLLDYSLLRCHV